VTVRFVLVLVLVLVLDRVAHAQAPTPTAGTPDASGFAYRYSAGLDGNVAIGVVDRYLLNVRGDVLASTPRFGIYVEPRFTYARARGTDTDRESYLRVVGFYRPRDKVYGFGVGLFERSLRRRYEYRVTGGAGVGWNAVKTPNVELLFAEGVVYEQTHFYNTSFAGHPDYDSESRGVVRAVTRASGRLKLAAKTTFFYDVYLKPSVTDLSDYRILAKATFELSVAPGITARALLDYTQETIRLEGTARDELMLSFGVAIRKD
jgi:hypothetical protein